ncbi:MAG: hypothetical protein HY673_07080 [Chloroflexi bacterium]|nr:hypothetical protein [Chloroflexota bacterium]
MERRTGFGVMFGVSLLLFLVAATALAGGCAQPTPTPPPPPTAAPTPFQPPAAGPALTPTPPPAAKPTPAQTTPAPTKPSPVPAKGPFYQGKTVTVVIAAGVGGGPDTVGRSLTGYLAKHIGNPRIVYENRQAGGGATGMQYFLQAKPDGLTWAVATGGVQMAWLSEAQGHNYDIRKAAPILSTTQSTFWYVDGKLKVRNVKELVALRRPITIGQTVVSSQSFKEKYLEKVLGFPIKQVFGYSSLNETKLAVLKGELDMSSQGSGVWSSDFASIAAAGQVVPLFQDGIGGDMRRSPAIATIPTITEVHQEMLNKPPGGKDWEGLKALILLRQIPIPLMVQTDIPPEAVETLKTGIKALMASEEFKDFAVTQVGTKDTERGYLFGDEIARQWQKFLDTPAEIVALLKEAP